MPTLADMREAAPGPDVFQVTEDITLVRHRPEDACEAYDFYVNNRERLDIYPHFAQNISEDFLREKFRIRRDPDHAGRVFDYWIVEAGQKIGDISASIKTSDATTAELGGFVAKEVESMGIATKAAGLLIAYLDIAHDVETINFGIHPEDRRGKRIAEHLGAVRKQELQPTTFLHRFKRRKYRKTDSEIWEINLHKGEQR